MSNPVPLSETLSELTDLLALSRTDGCPDCANVEPAKSFVLLEVGYRTSHSCADCGAAWVTDWRL